MSPRSNDSLVHAILDTLAYADLFDYAMTPEEIHRYLIEHVATIHEVTLALDDCTGLDGRAVRTGGFLTLRRREHLAALRHARSKHAARLWRKAHRYAWILAHLPFVRMIAVSGALAANNPGERDDDIDLFIITAPGRLWTARGLIIAVVRIARAIGNELCPNYLVSEDALRSNEQNLYTAHEIVHLVPLYGMALYRHYMRVNDWYGKFLPNAQPVQSSTVELNRFGQFFKHLAERILSTYLGTRLEQWEQTRKIAKFRAQVSTATNATHFTAECCKGHFQDHGRRVLAEFERRPERWQV